MNKFLSTFLVLVLLCINSITVHAYTSGNTYKAIGTHKLKVATTVKVGGMWAENWNQKDYKVATTISNDQFIVVLYPRNDEAWNYYCKITLKDFTIPDKKTQKTTQKKDLDFVYLCDVEFYYNVEYPSLEECFANYGGFVVNSKDKAAKKRIVEGAMHFNSYFFTVGNKFGDKENEKMMMSVVIDDLVYSMFLFDHLEFPRQ